MRLAAAVFAPVLLGLLPALVAAQDSGGECELVRSVGNLNIMNQGTPYQITFIPQPVIRCTGGIRVKADSAVMAQATRTVEFIGNVNYADTVKTLTSDYAQYVTSEKRVSARGKVVLTDVKRGSHIEAPYLDYFQVSDTLPESIVKVYSGRPHAVLIRAVEGDTAGADTTIVDAESMEIVGERQFSGRGNVEITRGTMRGWGNEARFTENPRTMHLAGAARVQSDSMTMRGDRIDAELGGTDELRYVAAIGNASLEGSEMTVTAPAVQVLFETGKVNRLIAIGGAKADSTGAVAGVLAATRPVGARQVVPPPRGAAARAGRTGTDSGPSAPQATVVSRDLSLTADSIDALAPGQELERVVAVGAAYAQRLNQDTLADSLAVLMPDTLKHDWMQGDTIVATFAEAPPGATADSATTGSDRVLESVLARGAGQPAVSLYRVPNENDPDAPPGFNYLTAQSIRVALRDGKVAHVEAEGAVHGLYIQPAAAVRAKEPGAVSPPSHDAGAGKSRP